MKRFSVSGVIALVAVLVALNPGAAAEKTQSIGIIQYNAKGGQRVATGDKGWDENGVSLPIQIDLLVDAIKNPAAPAQVDFITLVQADKPALADYLAANPKYGVAGWKTIRGGCKGVHNDKSYFEATQLSYSSDWTLVSGASNPLADDFHSDHCWASGRAYNIAYFQNVRNPGLKILYVIMHAPHCPGYGGSQSGLGRCLERDWPKLAQFHQDVRTVAGVQSDSELKGVNIIISGDTNELGDGSMKPLPPPGDARGYEMIFRPFAPLAVSSLDGPTCCNDSGYNHYFDRIVVNNAAAPPRAQVIKPKSGDYPLFGPAGANEEHKAIYGVVVLPLP